ncbi:MAG TPA: flagellar biosynthetic protein FliO [Terriglobales bacterium]|jgi:flagellar biogenesis protein FliO|nr:flagellar biosynthetic protein FliO [Terriglobales bacterium]
MTLLWLYVTPSPADSAADQLTSINSQIVQYVEVLLALAGVLVLAYVVLKVGLPRMFGMRTSSGGPIQVLARYPLEPKKTLYLVKAGSQVFLVGTAENQVAYLTAIAPENAEEMIGVAGKEEAPAKEFRRFLSRIEKGREG